MKSFSKLKIICGTLSVITLLAACSSSTPTQTALFNTDLCTIFDKTKLTEYFGEKYDFNKLSNIPTENANTCTIKTPADVATGKAVAIVIREEKTPQAAAEGFNIVKTNEDRTRDKTTWIRNDLSGIGDQAYFASNNMMGQLTGYKNNLFLTISTTGFNEKSKEVAEYLAKTILSQ